MPHKTRAEIRLEFTPHDFDVVGKRLRRHHGTTTTQYSGRIIENFVASIEELRVIGAGIEHQFGMIERKNDPTRQSAVFGQRPNHVHALAERRTAD